MFRQAQHDKQPCHPERSEGSQQTLKTKEIMNKTIHDTFLQICKSANSQICKLVHYRILFLILFPLWGLGGYAQPYEWDWAINGGSNLAGYNYWRYDAEQVYDIVVGSDDNYYFLASMNGKASNTPSGSQLAG